ncbi:hypothetical protein BEL04_14515 [Mucilaginibacter sp. PPCGB 2223]|uniref:hypothetical protein n=1 Tax=Mucilaginibacter sp. PPCGB 2223 TaxID=1886027 RepID=UPI0008271F26|nr:hypothetical protein [Mucilaginibacter sp. PPCGB 2223]OCX52656.1 hypothetical protein BEL04_14515 [Mucilaginibacter sp. PPCGB 2223]
MKQFFNEASARFKSAVPNFERKLQIALSGAVTTFLAISQITWPGKLSIIATIAGYASALCAGMALIIQFTEDTIKKFDEAGTAPTASQSTAASITNSNDFKTPKDGQLNSPNTNTSSPA